jgi:hypothetical protein
MVSVFDIRSLPVMVSFDFTEVLSFLSGLTLSCHELPGVISSVALLVDDEIYSEDQPQNHHDV